MQVTTVNFSEGELSEEDEDVNVNVVLSSKSSNYTNTSVVNIQHRNVDEFSS